MKYFQSLTFILYNIYIQHNNLFYKRNMENLIKVKKIEYIFFFSYENDILEIQNV